MTLLARLFVFAAAVLAAQGASAQTIYPLDRAEILAGARFDLESSASMESEGTAKR